MSNRTQKEINEAISLFMAKENNKELDAIIDVLENDLTYDKIELRYFDENNPWIEQAAIRALDYLEGNIELTEII